MNLYLKFLMDVPFIKCVNVCFVGNEAYMPFK